MNHDPMQHPSDPSGWLIATGLEKAYRGRRVVRDASVAVRSGEAVGLLGPNGAGKTTIFYMITGLVAADGGRITLDGHDITALPMYRRARLGIGYLPQEASIFRGLSVEDNIRAVLELVEKDRDRREAELLEQRRFLRRDCGRARRAGTVLDQRGDAGGRRIFHRAAGGEEVACARSQS